MLLRPEAHRSTIAGLVGMLRAERFDDIGLRTTTDVGTVGLIGSIVWWSDGSTLVLGRVAVER